MDTLRTKLDGLIRKNAKLFSMKLTRKMENPFVLQEDYHLSTPVVNELFSWGLQMTVSIAGKNRVHLMMFLDPIVVDDTTRSAFIQFANAANMRLGAALGKFCVNEDNDFYYECYLPGFFVDNLRELEQQLFDIPFSHFQTCLTPLMQLKDGKWDADIAISYYDELWDAGVIDNSKYGLW